MRIDNAQWQKYIVVNASGKKAMSPDDLLMRDRINAARVACVLMMMYVHVPGGQEAVESIAVLTPTRLDHWFEAFLIEGPGRASAALLSVVSGYLAAVTLLRGKSSVKSLYQRRFMSVVVPMVCWALLTCFVYIALGQADTSFRSETTTWLGKLNYVFFLTDTPYGPTMHLGFLRDLFVCVLLSPLLLLALRHAANATVGLLAIIYLIEHSGQLVIILRPLVILGFTLGMLLALRRTRLDQLDEHWALFLAMTTVFAVLIIWTNAGLLNPIDDFLFQWNISLKESFLYPMSRLSGSLAIWCLLPLLLQGRLRQVVAKFSPYLFAAFCSHFLVLTLLFNGLWLPVLGGTESYAHIVWFICAPIISMAVAIAMVNVVARIYPPIASLMTGGRVAVVVDTSKDVSGKLPHPA